MLFLIPVTTLICFGIPFTAIILADRRYATLAEPIIFDLLWRHKRMSVADLSKQTHEKVCGLAPDSFLTRLGPTTSVPLIYELIQHRYIDLIEIKGPHSASSWEHDQLLLTDKGEDRVTALLKVH